jgi:hypothetical protein
MPKHWLILLGIVLAAAARAWLHFSTPMIQGMNGAYYLVQARSLIEKAALAIPDLPLTFALHAACAKAVHAVLPLSLEQAVMFAVKSLDSLLPALAVIPVVLLGERWSRDDHGRWRLLPAVLAGVIVAAGAPALLMVGDFQKNSLGLALLCTLALMLHRWVQRPDVRRSIAVVIVLGLIGITHIGVFGTALLLVMAVVGALTLMPGQDGARRAVRILLLAAPVVIAAGAIVAWRFDPARVQKLLAAFSDPMAYLAAGQGPGPGRMPGMGPGGALMGGAQMLVFFGVSLGATFMAWKQRARLGLPTLAVIIGIAATVMALTGPWVQGDKAMRFTLNAVPLAVLGAMFLALRLGSRWWHRVPALIVMVAALVPTMGKLIEGPRPIITAEALKELQSLVPDVQAPRATLIVTRHGLEWWTAWTLHTHIAQERALTPQDWHHYQHVWFLQQQGGRGRGPGSGSMGPPRPPESSMPSTALILHQGAHFTLGWAKEPTDTLRAKERAAFDIFSDWGTPP